MVILDGASDWPIPELGFRTCLQAASTPNLDSMASEGIVGLASTVPSGTEPSSSAACMSILGYDPVAEYIGRGAIEAASLGIDLQPDEVALRLNLVAVEDGVMKSYSGGHISTAESHSIVSELAAELDDDSFRLYPGVSYRHILVVSGRPELLGCEYTPPHDISDKPIAEYLPKGAGVQMLLDYMTRAQLILHRGEANKLRASQGKLEITDVWPFWPGMKPGKLTSFSDRFGISAAMTSGVDLLGGLAKLTGMDRLTIAGVTDGPDNDYLAQALGAISALRDYQLVVVHVESPDEAGHAGDLSAKIGAIEAIDREILSRIREIPNDVRVLAMPDHATPIELKTHVGEPVPFLLWGAGVEPNGDYRFDESSAEKSGLMVDPGHKIMELLLER